MQARIICFLILSTAYPALAALDPTPRAVRAISDQTMVVNDRGARLEVMPAKRATPGAVATGRATAHRVFASKSTARIGTQQLGVVFNHATQSEGYITGEIAFALKDGAHPTVGFDSTSYPGLARLTGPNVYIVKSRTPAEFIAVLNRLQSRPDIEWVEPAVIYGAAQARPAIK